MPAIRAGALIAAVAVVAIVVLVVGRGGGSTSGAGGVTGSADQVSTAPGSFVLPRLVGSGTVRLADFRGKPTVVDFFASWCTACRGELPGFARVAQQLKGTVNFIGVNSSETGDGLAMARQYGLGGWPLARDVDGAAASGLHDNLGQQGMPISAFYDAAGRLVFVAPGALTEDELRALLHQYFAV
jgi:thiol-disulfide isomerase/thioredoxin